MNNFRTVFVAIFALSLLLLSSCRKNGQIKHQSISDVMLSDSSSFFHVPAENYPASDPTLPIGIFDSGTGGLTVLDAIVNYDRYDNAAHKPKAQGDGIRDFQAECFIYLGDQANMPYGNYDREGKVDLLKEHIFKDVQFLLGNKYYRRPKDKTYASDKKPIKALVIACNTATAYGKADIENFLDRAGIDMKVIGVIDAGVRGALQALGGSGDASLAIMATAGTVASQGYVKAMRRQLQASGYQGQIDIFQQAGIGLAGAIDGSPEFISPAASSPRAEYKGPAVDHPDAPVRPDILPRYGFDWTGGRMLFTGSPEEADQLQINSVGNYIAYHVVSLMEKIRQASPSGPLKAIILGCTHYPFYRDVIARNLDRLYNYQEDGRYLYRPFMAEQVVLIDPAENTARELYEYLQARKLYNASDLAQSEFYISVANLHNPNVQVDSAGNFTYEYKYGRQAGQIQEYVRRVPFSRQTIPQDIVDRLESKIPLTFELIRAFDRTNPKMSAVSSEVKF